MAWRGRRRSFAQRQFRASMLRWSAANWIAITVVSLGLVAMAGVLATILNGYLLGLGQGLLVTAGAAALFVLFLMHTGAIWQLAGATGEDNTNDELKTATRRRRVWGWVPNIELEDGDVDHLVIAPSGALAIDSKWHAKRLDEATLSRDVRKAQRSAQRARSVLRSLKRPLEMRPVVVVWGAGQRDLPVGGCDVEGVAVVPGRSLVSWLNVVAVGPVGEDHAATVLAELRAFRARVDPSLHGRPVKSTS